MNKETLANPQAAAPPAAARGENLALIFQELVTVIVRMRSGRQEIANAEMFRSQVLQAIRLADQAAKAATYTDESIQLATFAVVAFLDESILNLRKPIFADWVRKPLQEELFGRHVAGEQFFVHMVDLLGRRDSAETADTLEVYYLCLLLGYLGKYSISSRGELQAMMGQTAEKIQRIRKTKPDFSPRWAVEDNLPTGAAVDPWLKRLMIGCGAAGVLATALFLTYKLMLSSGIATVQELAGRR